MLAYELLHEVEGWRQWQRRQVTQNGCNRRGEKANLLNNLLGSSSSLNECMAHIKKKQDTNNRN